MLYGAVLAVISGTLFADVTFRIQNQTGGTVAVWPIPKNEPPRVLATLTDNAEAKLSVPDDLNAILVFDMSIAPLLDKSSSKGMISSLTKSIRLGKDGKPVLYERFDRGRAAVRGGLTVPYYPYTFGDTKGIVEALKAGRPYLFVQPNQKLIINHPKKTGIRPGDVNDPLYDDMMKVMTEEEFNRLKRGKKWTNYQSPWSAPNAQGRRVLVGHPAGYKKIFK